MKDRASRQPEATVSQPASSSGFRVSFLLGDLFDGNQAAMARAIGCSRSAISRVASGIRPPGRDLLERISEKTEVSPTWLLTGRGVPFPAASEEETGPEIQLRILDHPLPGPLPRSETAITHDSLLTPSSLATPSRYWLRLQAETAVGMGVGERIAVGDLLLIETDITRFRSHPATLCGRLGVIHLPTELGGQTRLVRFYDVSERQGERDASDLAVGGVAIEVKQRTASLVIADPTWGSSRSSGRDLDAAGERPKAVRGGVKAVVGVAEALLRQQP